uniref:Transmembrane protein n=1 Tax=Glossina austeni TaxID=7395 RepID=A0A1A9V975_GLOAU
MDVESVYIGKEGMLFQMHSNEPPMVVFQMSLSGQLREKKWLELFKNLKRSSLLTHRISLIFTFLYLLLYLWSRNRNSTEFSHEVNFDMAAEVYYKARNKGSKVIIANIYIALHSFRNNFG